MLAGPCWLRPAWIIVFAGRLAWTFGPNVIGCRLPALFVQADGRTRPQGSLCGTGKRAGRRRPVRQKLRTTTFPFAEVSIDFHSGEILGLAGLVGAGRTELAHALFGIDATEGGTVLLDGAPVRFASSTDAVRAGVFLVPEDRKRMGLLVDFAITENITLPNLSAYARGLTISREAERARANKSRGELDIRAPDLAARAGSLSGGNQQKIVLAKWLAMNPRVIIFDEPTRGIDVGAKSEIYRLMRTLADAGVAVLMISSDMEEVIGVSDRVAVMHQGRISGILARAQCREENILQLAVGKGVAEQANWAGKTQCQISRRTSGSSSSSSWLARWSR